MSFLRIRFMECSLGKNLFLVLSSASITLASQTTPAEPSPCNSEINLIALKNVVVKSPKDPNDDRGPIEEAGPKAGLNPDEIKRFRETTGKIHCSGPQGISGSATLVGNGSTIVTAAHAFVDERTGKNRFAKPDCTFTTLSKPPVTRKLLVEIGNTNRTVIGKHFPIGSSNDFAIVKLDKPIEGVNPFPVDLSNTQTPFRQKSYVISALQKELSTFDSTQPIVETCSVTGNEFGSQTTTYENRCHIDGGASGGGQFVRSSSGQLVFKGIMIEGGQKINNPLDPENGNSTNSVGVESSVLANLIRLDPSITSGHGAVSSLKD